MSRHEAPSFEDNINNSFSPILLTKASMLSSIKNDSLVMFSAVSIIVSLYIPRAGPAPPMYCTVITSKKMPDGTEAI